MCANVSFEHEGERHHVKMKLVQPLPDIPIVSGKQSVFPFIECWTSTIITTLVLKLVQEKCPTVQRLLCAHPECKNPAVGSCNWYPFPIHTWDGISIPEIISGDASQSALWHLYAWCGGSCKMDMLMYALTNLRKYRDIYHLTGGDYYCFYCGRMNTLDDYDNLKDVKGLEGAAYTHALAEQLPVFINLSEKLVYCRGGECEAKCRQRAPPQLLKQMHEVRKKL